ncbi:hypothetical protein [Glutamicibacter uratoxydans]|uniref:hypothetical protein n=1 Tax=Glutamicibacter uratoxydans TaxID=43667 RepID=UPI003D6ECFBC
MRTTVIPEVDPMEVRFSQWIVNLFEHARSMSEALDSEESVDPDSGFFVDNERLPVFRVPDYARSQISVALGCIEALELMVMREGPDTFEIRIFPYGQFALLRNALDSLAVCLWLLDPVSSTGRVKRRLQLEVDETYKGSLLKQTVGQPVKDWKRERRARIRQLAEEAGVVEWNPLKAGLPTTTKMLESIERYHTDPVMPWLGWWQLASGHAHGKMWAKLASHELEEVEGSRDGSSATYRVTANFGMLAGMLFETMKMTRCALERYQTLGRAKV